MTDSADLLIDYDRESDVVRVNGVPYAGDLFRAFGLSPPGTWLRIEGRRADGALTVFTVCGSVQRTFDAIAGRSGA